MTERTVFRITDFGAVPDGATDCTRAVQEAMDAAADCMGTVEIPTGRFAVSGLHLRGHGVSLIGTPAFGNYSGASVLVLKDPTGDALLNISGSYGATIKGVCFEPDGWRDAYLGKTENPIRTVVHGIKIDWDDYNGAGEPECPTIDDCSVVGFTGDGLHFRHAWCFTVRHSQIACNGGAGMYFDGWDAYILDNWLTGNRGGGLVGGPVFNSLTFTGNRVEWNYVAGVALPHGDSYQLTGNFFDRTFGPAISLGSDTTEAVLATVTGNIFRRNGAYDEGKPHADLKDNCHILLRHASGVTVTGNAAQRGIGDGNVGVLSPEYGFIVENSKNVVITSNAMQNGAITENILLRGENEGLIVRDNAATTDTDVHTDNLP